MPHSTGRVKSGPAARIELIARAVWIFDGQVLLCRNSKHGYFYLPGGHVEVNEDAPAACRRELKEEAGIDVRVGPCLLIAEVRFHQGGKSRHEVNLVFHVEPAANMDCAGNTPPQVASREPGIAFEWTAISNVASLDVRPGVIRTWLKPKRDGQTVLEGPPEFISVIEDATGARSPRSKSGQSRIE